MLVDARQADPGRGGSLQAAVTTAFLLLNGEGDIDTAHRLLTGAIATQAGRYDPADHALIEALYTLCTVCAFGGRPELWEPFHRALARLAPDGSTGLSLCARLFADPARATPAAVDELETMINRLHDQSDPGLATDRLLDHGRELIGLGWPGGPGVTVDRIADPGLVFHLRRRAAPGRLERPVLRFLS